MEALAAAPAVSSGDGGSEGRALRLLHCLTASELEACLSASGAARSTRRAAKKSGVAVAAGEGAEGAEGASSAAAEGADPDESEGVRPKSVALDVPVPASLELAAAQFRLAALRLLRPTLAPPERSVGACGIVR